MPECELLIRYFYGKAAIYMKEIGFRVVVTICVVMLAVMAFMPVPAEAKTKKHLSAKSKTLTVGQEYTLKLKGLTKKEKQSNKSVRWKISDKSVAVFKGKTEYTVTLKARKTGTTKVTGIYKGKKYTCKITVQERTDGSEADNAYLENEADSAASGNTSAKLNATGATLFYFNEEDKNYIAPDTGHSSSFQFKVSGVPKDEIIRWSIQSTKSISAFMVSDDGNVYLWKDPAVLDGSESATVVAKLEDGTRLTATLQGYSERGIAVKKRMEEFHTKYITDSMTEYEKMETIAKYVESEYDYVLYQSDWRKMVISGGGDCYASRYLVKYLCDAEGIKALACLGENYDGDTLVKADGKMYIVVTGFDEPKPRRYMIMEMTEQTLRNVAEGSRIDLSYFD
jgi:hypothetical protein